ncbi:MAG: thioredoxin domain-containing protein [Thiobacillaceae bacterium]|nr:thioredoxin domain-containing protein [Thiobacillaceae bacterium]
MPNRLAAETSPYLRQHADNPVDWYPWGEEAFARARAEDKPVLLSIGYSTCHWCHVMAHESFADPDVAAVMNRLFVNVKVDREERPDLDQIYQTAHQLLARRPGGWPLTVFLTPDGVPFFAGTYFPKQARFGLPGFVTVLERIHAAYRTQRAAIERQNAGFIAALAALEAGEPIAGGLEAGPIRSALEAIKAQYDPQHGGYGRAPKFPRAPDLDFLLQAGDEEARQQVLHTLRRMAAGGLMDQVGGGFFRYSVDAHWGIPHFEKMLYDNGQLLALYADAWALSGQALHRTAVELTVEWLTREMMSPEGLFYSALDADSEGEEGRHYLWTREPLQALLSTEDYALVAAVWGLDRAPNFEGRTWHLGCPRPFEAVAAALEMDEAVLLARLAPIRARLLAARAQREHPGLDDKVLTAWNALTIKGLARAARRFARPDWLALAQGALDALRARVWRDDRLYASWQAGQAKLQAYLDDYALVIDALLELMQAEFRPQDLAWAQTLADGLLARFEDVQGGGFWFTAHDHERLIHRPKPIHDQALPAGTGVAARVLARLALLTGEARYAGAAERAVRAHWSAMQTQPAACTSLLTALRDVLEPPPLVVLRGPAEQLAQWQGTVQRRCPARTLCLALNERHTRLPPPLDKPLRQSVAAHVCTGGKCLPEIVRLELLETVFSV